MPWEAGEKYEAVARAATATAIHAVTSPALNDLPRYRTELLHNVLWLMTEAPSGKYTTRYRTAAVVQDAFAALRHEHVYTRKALTAELLAANSADIEGLLRTRAVACVVTKDEHDRLSRFDNTYAGWARYETAGITVLDMSTGNVVDLRRLA